MLFLHMVYQLIYMYITLFPSWPFRTYYMPQWERLKRQKQMFAYHLPTLLPTLGLNDLPSIMQAARLYRRTVAVVCLRTMDWFIQPKKLVVTEFYVTWIVLHVTSVKYVKLT